MHKLFFSVITAARRRLWITTPYFIPDESISQAIALAALSGVDVRVLVPHKGDSRVVDWAARSLLLWIALNRGADRLGPRSARQRDRDAAHRAQP